MIISLSQTGKQSRETRRVTISHKRRKLARIFTGNDSSPALRFLYTP
jgi:hypothetical protein